MQNNLEKKFWELPTQIKNGYLRLPESTSAEVDTTPLVMIITNGKVTGWEPLN